MPQSTIHMVANRTLLLGRKPASVPGYTCAVWFASGCSTTASKLIAAARKACPALRAKDFRVKTITAAMSTGTVLVEFKSNKVPKGFVEDKYIPSAE